MPVAPKLLPRGASALATALRLDFVGFAEVAKNPMTTCKGNVERLDRDYPKAWCVSFSCLFPQFGAWGLLGGG